jgi:hypothetical protein
MQDNHDDNDSAYFLTVVFNCNLLFIFYITKTLIHPQQKKLQLLFIRWLKLGICNVMTNYDNKCGCRYLIIILLKGFNTLNYTSVDNVKLFDDVNWGAQSILSYFYHFNEVIIILMKLTTIFPKHSFTMSSCLKRLVQMTSEIRRMQTLAKWMKIVLKNSSKIIRCLSKFKRVHYSHMLKMIFLLIWL